MLLDWAPMRCLSMVTDATHAKSDRRGASSRVERPICFRASSRHILHVLCSFESLDDDGLCAAMVAYQKMGKQH